MLDQEPSVFTRIIRGELPARFVWSDDRAVAFLTIEPIRPGHTLVIPREQVDRWTDLELPTWLHLNEIALTLGRAISETFGGVRVATIIAGLEVPHTHIHLIPFEKENELSFANADPNASAESLDAAAESIRATLHAQSSGPR